MKQKIVNRVSLVFDSKSENEAFSRIVVAGFVVGLGITAEELADIKTAVSEAVTNAIVHAYREGVPGKIRMDLKLFDTGRLRITVADRGCGIADIARAREPFFTTDREHERTGMGFSIMETFMSKLNIRSVPGRGTRIVMEKTLSHIAAHIAA